MTGVIFSPAAQTDIDKIWDYTATSWNVDQAERYIQNIRDACHELAEGRRMSRPSDIRKGYRKGPCLALIFCISKAMMRARSSSCASLIKEWM
ncbi:type II toxin-antitoxin system RelE/ParE family toxin [Rhizobium laguerreae]